MMTFGAAFADVMDFHAVGDGIADDTAAIQAAIDSGRHVMFPQGTYRVTSVVTFYQDGGRCQLLSGAVIVLDGPDAYVRVGPRRGAIPADDATEQRFTDLCIEADGTSVHSPLLEIDQAAGARFDDLRVAAAGQAEVLVRVTRLTRCQFFGGVVDGGVGAAGGKLASASRIGLLLETIVAGVEEVDEVGAQGLQVVRCQTALHIVGPTDNPVFVGCHFGATTTGVALSCLDGGAVFNLNLVGCAFEGESCNQFLYLDDSGSLSGGVVSGCRFGALTDATARVFRIHGSANGIPVTGCFHDGDAPVWEIDGSMTKTCDQFNHWTATTLADGIHPEYLVVMNADATGVLTITSAGLQLDSDRLGFFDTTPVSQPAAYTVGGTYNVRRLTHAHVFSTLATLIQDLQKLGVIG